MLRKLKAVLNNALTWGVSWSVVGAAVGLLLIPLFRGGQVSAAQVVVNHGGGRRRRTMRAYLIVTGVVFGVLVAIHLARVIIEGPGVAADPFFVGATVVAAGMALWALRLLRRLGKEPGA